MPESSSEHRLVLHPVDARAKPKRNSWLPALQALGLVGGELRHAGQPRYRIGERFLQLVTFLGCSPAIGLEPEEDGFCHVSLELPEPAPVFRADAQLKTPRCPACGRAPGRKGFAPAAWICAPAQRVWTCPGCGVETAAVDLDWRQSGGWGSAFISIWGVFPAEAVPTPELLVELAGLGCGDWRYFYL